MELAKLERKIPIKSIPIDELNRIILSEFTVWVANLLSLTDEVSADRLTIALPAIKDHCWSMGFDEIVKMFEMYVDGKLTVKPMSNFFDRVLLGKIVASYKEQKPPKKKAIPIPEVSEAEKLLLTNKGVLRSYDEYKEKGDVGSGTSWIYDHLDELGVFSFNKDQKQKSMVLAKTLEKSEVNIKKPGAKNILEMLEEKRSPRVINRAKRILLNDYFKIVERETLVDALNSKTNEKGKLD